LTVFIAFRHALQAECDIVLPIPSVRLIRIPSLRPCRCCDLSSRFRSLGRGIIVFEPKFKGERHFAGSLNTRVWKICYFRPKLPFISETVRDTLCLLWITNTVREGSSELDIIMDARGQFSGVYLYVRSKRLT